MIADATGSCRLVLWADHIGTLKEGQSYHLKSVAVRQYKNQQYMSILERTTDLENINDIGPVNERHCVAATKTLSVKSEVFYRLSCISAVLSVNQKYNKLTAFVVSAKNVVD